MSLLAQSQKWYPTHVKVVVIQARGLRSKGRDGTNDAYAIMQLGKEKYSSSVAEKSGVPQWREEAEFELPVLQSGNPREQCTLYLIVMHRALVGLDKFLGQAAIDLTELFESKTRNKVGWHKLQSKNGKKEKERGEIEADIRFVRNNMTASMFDLSMKDKSRSTLGRLKDKFKGKKKDGFSDSASAIVPSIGTPGDSDDDDAAPAPAAEKKKKSKLKRLFPKSNLQRTSLSQSMSVIPTSPSTSPGNSSKAKDFGKEDFTEIKLHDSAEEEISNKALYVPKIMSHKRAASADTKQLNFASAGNLRKDALSLFSGLKTKSDPMSQSNLCINGSHVYTEEPSQAAAAPKPRTDPRPLYSSQFHPSAEDLTGRFSPDAPEPGGPLSPSRTSPGTSPGEQAPKPPAPPEIRASGSASDLSDPQRADRVKEGTDSRQGGAPGAGKRGMDQKAETNSAPATGGRSLNPFDNDEDKMAAHPGSKIEVSKAEVSNAEQTTKKEETKRGGLMSFFPRKTEAVKGPEAKEPRNPFDAHGEEAKWPPGMSVWSSRTAAIKPKLEVSPKAETMSPLAPPSPPFPSASADSPSPPPPVVAAATEGARNSNFASLHVAYSPPAMLLDVSPARSSPDSKCQPLASPPPPVEEPDDARLPPLPSSSSSSLSSRSSDAEASGSPGAGPAGGESRGAPKQSARALLQELAGKSSSVNAASAEQVEECEGFSGDQGPGGADLQCNLESGQEDGKVTRERQPPRSSCELGDSPANTSQGPEPSLHPVSSPPSETSVSIIPPKVPLRSRVPGPEGTLNPEPLSAEIRKLPPTPAPRNVPRVTVTDDSSHPPEEIPGEDLPPCEGGTDYRLQPLTATPEVGDADFAPGLGSPDQDSLTGGQEENERSLTPSGIADRPSAISTRCAYEGGAHGYPVAEVETGDLPVKVEDSAGGGRATHAAGKTGWLESPPPLFEPATNLLAHEMLGHTPPPDPIEDHIADLECLGALQPGATGRSTGGNSGVQEAPVSAPTGDRIVTEERGPFDMSPALGDRRSEDVEISMGFPPADDLLTKPDSSDHFTLSSSEESSIERKPETSGSSVAVPLLSAQASPPCPSASSTRPCLLSPLPPSASPPPLPQSTPPLTAGLCSVRTPAGNPPEVERSDQKRPFQARVSPTETQPIQSQSSGSAVSSRHRPHAVKPMSAMEIKTHEVTAEENLKPRYKTVDATGTKSSTGRLLGLNQSRTSLKDYDPSDAAAAYAQLTHDELIQLVLKQKDVIARKDSHVRELENYIDNLLVRVMEETPGILRVACPPNRQAERV